MTSTTPATATLRMRLLGTTAPKAVVLIRFVVGWIFLTEGVQKFLFPGELGPGRFAKTPLPAPEFFAYLDGVFEIVCGALLIVGLLTRLAAIPMIVDMLGAQILTKATILTHQGFWSYMHESRVEWAQLFGSVFLLIVGAGAFSLDAVLTAPRRTSPGDTGTP
ncbi:DoxX family protein [Saccharopolyspora sp. NPDC050642]|uniref:DoxX family protein n=1 Tax=Saccharopolyspora sp. NPDC050642 TaxID=3157099 RepID=UPI0033F7C27A